MNHLKNRPARPVRLLTLLSLGSLLSCGAWAQSESYYFGGLSLGESKSTLNLDGITSSLLPAGVTLTDRSRDTRGLGGKLFGGYQFNRNLGLEAGYFRLGTFGVGGNTTGAGALRDHISLQGLNLDFVGSLPMGERWTAQGRVGGQRARSTDAISLTGLGATASEPTRSSNGYKLGLGLQYALSPDMMLRGDLERYRVHDTTDHAGHVDMLSLGLVMAFGRGAAPAPRPLPPVTLAPPPPAPPAPAPMAVVTPPPPPPPLVKTRVSFSAESLFGFDKSGIRPEGAVALDRLTSDLVKVQYELITVEGHTDRLGTTAYNQKLSTERAEAVKTYLSAPGRLDGSRIKAVGMGETQPVTHAEDCKGQSASPKLIACLQADRRVEVEVNGLK